MSWLRAIGRETLGLFVDDGRFAVLILAWLVLAYAGLPRLGLGDGWAGSILFAGLVAILVDSVIRKARS